MIQSKGFVTIALLIALSVVALSCQSKGQAPSFEPDAAHRALDKGPRQNTKQQPWPGAYPQPTSLKGLRSVAVKVYADRGIPSGRIATGPFADEIERMVVQELRNAGIVLVNEKEAEAMLSMSL